MNFILYKTTNLVNKKFYIGMHITSNLNDGYIGSGKILRRSINKYSKENFKFEILKHCNSRQELCEAEKEIVNNEILNDKLCMNLKLGGDGGWDFVNKECHNNRHNKRRTGFLNYLKKGINCSVEAKKRYSPERYKLYINILSKSMKKFHENNPNYASGWKHSEDSKIKMKEFQKGKQKGSRNSQYGTCWIYNEIKSIKIKKEKLMNIYKKVGKKVEL